MASKKAKGKRSKTRRKLRRRGSRLTIKDFLEKPALDSKVLIAIDSSVHSGMPSAKYQGAIGTVKAAKKNCVEVVVGKTGREKTLTVHPAHLTAIGGGSK